MRLKYVLCFLVDSTDNDAASDSTLKGKLPELRELLANDMPSHAIEQANQEV